MILIGGAIVGCLFWPIFAAATIWRALTVGDDGALAPAREMADVYVYILALAGAWSIALPASVAQRLRGARLSLRTVALMPVYYVLVCAATWTALIHLAIWPIIGARPSMEDSGRGQPFASSGRDRRCRRLSSVHWS